MVQSQSEMIKNKKVLISGVTGFVGANLLRRCVKDGAKVYIFTRPTSDKWRISDLKSCVKQYCVDLSDAQALKKCVDDIKPDIIFHIAVFGGRIDQSNIYTIMQTNFLGTVNLLNACMDVGFELFVNTGSSSEYGIKDSPMKEGDSLEPISDYGVSKAASTLYCQAIAKREKKPIVSLRLFSPYGYYEDKDRLIPSVILSCLNETTLQLSSPGHVRDFIFIDDVVDCYLKAVKYSDKITSEVLNVGFAKQHSIEEVVDNVMQLTGSKASPGWGEAINLRSEPKMWQADIARTQQVLDWKPSYDLNKGLKKTVDWFRKNSFLYKN